MNKKHLFLVLKKGSYHEIDKLPYILYCYAQHEH